MGRKGRVSVRLGPLLIITFFSLGEVRAAESESCSTSSLRALRETAAKSIVEIKAVARYAMGIALPNGKVLTDEWAAARGRAFTIEGDEAVLGSVVARHGELALVDAPDLGGVDGQGTRVATSDPALGAPLYMAIYDDGVLTLHQVNVTAETPVARISEPYLGEETWIPGGAPLFSCDGRLVGLGLGGPRFAPASEIRRLEREPETPYVGRWSVEGTTDLPLLIEGTPREGERGVRAYTGVGFGVDVLYHDRLTVPFHLQILALANGREDEDGELPYQHLSALRLQLNTGLGYRWLLDGREGLYLVPAAMVGIGYDGTFDERREAFVRPGCTPRDLCPVSTVDFDENQHRASLATGVSLGLHWSIAHLRYGVQFEHTRRSAHAHRLDLGVSIF
ncbi:MAG: hypothetical protein AAGA56_11555 [Myxococcota bacterium]